MQRGIVLNARYAGHRPTGMQRYAAELAARFGERIEKLQPRKPLRGPVGHAWEQVYLPGAVRGRLLWSPNNTGPIAVNRQVCTVHDLIPLDHPEWFTPSFAAWYAWLLPRLMKSVQHIVAISEFTKTRLLERLGVPTDKITVILNGVDTRFSPCPADEIEQVSRSLGLPTGRYVLSVGSIEPRKNTARLLDAWAKIQDRVPKDTNLVITGASGSARVFSQVRLSALPKRVFFSGYVADEQLPALYSGALAMIYPSLYEGFGLPPLEAMACGSPVITSNYTSLPEVVGNAAVLVDPFDVDAIADAMERVIHSESLRQDLRTKALERARRITWDRTADCTWQVLQAQASI